MTLQACSKQSPLSFNRNRVPARSGAAPALDEGHGAARAFFPSVHPPPCSHRFLAYSCKQSKQNKYASKKQSKAEIVDRFFAACSPEICWPKRANNTEEC